MAEDEDAPLVEACRRGDRAAMQQLILKYQRQLFNLAFRMLGDRDDAADVAQSAFLKAFENLGRFDDRYRFFSWLYRIAVNEAIDRRQRNFRRERLDEDRESETDSVEDTVAKARLARRVQEGLMQLSEDYRAVMVLRHFSDCSYEAMAEILQLPEKTVKSRLYTARQLLRDWLRAHGVTEL